MNGLRQFIPGEGRIPRPVASAQGADFRGNYQIARVRRERLADDFVGYVGTIKVGRIDMVDPACDGLTQYGDRLVHIPGRAPYPLVAISPGELHGTVSHAVQS